RMYHAFSALGEVNLIQEHDSAKKAQVRHRSLVAWLQLVRLLDQFRDPNFNPGDQPELLVQPPKQPGGVVLRPGADPALIADPKERAEYEKAIAASRAKLNHYRLQIQLSRLNERIPPDAEAFIRTFYTAAPHDQKELRDAIEGWIQDPARKASLLK